MRTTINIEKLEKYNTVTLEESILSIVKELSCRTTREYDKSLDVVESYARMTDPKQNNAEAWAEIDKKRLEIFQQIRNLLDSLPHHK